MVIAWLSLREQRKQGLTGMPALPALVSRERALIREMRPALAKLLPHAGEGFPSPFVENPALINTALPPS